MNNVSADERVYIEVVIKESHPVRSWRTCIISVISYFLDAYRALKIQPILRTWKW